MMVAIYLWLAVGGAVGIPFVFWGANRKVEGMTSSGLGFRLWILPSTVILWPLTVWIWATRSGDTP